MRILKLKTLKDINDFETKLVTCDFADCDIDNDSPACTSTQIEKSNSLGIDNSLSLLNRIANYIIKGDYSSVLQIDLLDYNFPPFKIPRKHLYSALHVPNDDDYGQQINQFILIFISIAALKEFIRLNFCGPQFEVDRYNVISNFISDISYSELISYQSFDGESIYSNVVHPELLCVSHFILFIMKNTKSLTQRWWLLRCTFLHEIIRPETNKNLHYLLEFNISEVKKADWISNEKFVRKRLVFVIECCHIYLYYGEIVEARKYLEEALSICGLEIDLSETMDRRKRNTTPQLFVKLERKHFNIPASVPHKSRFFPPIHDIENDVLLDKVSFIDNNNQAVDNLCVEEQAAILAYCCLVLKKESIEESLLGEIRSYINCLLFQPQVWSIYVKALIMRYHLEMNKSKYLEKAVMQMKSIVQYIKYNSQPPHPEREQFFFCTSFPSNWSLEKNLADLLLSIGCTESALDIYEKLELWEEIVDCYIRLGRTSSAEKIVREQLQKGENPMLLCLLGDVTENIDYYFNAWELSKKKSARAQRSLGYYYLRKKEYKKSLEHFVSSLEINNLQPSLWLSTGHAATEAEDFELAARAYSHVVMFDKDNFVAWNNLANAYMKTNEKKNVWISVEEALKYNYDDWKIWVNFLFISTSIGAFEDAIRVSHHLLDIKNELYFPELLEILVKAVIKDFPDISDCLSSSLKKQTMKLFERITSVNTNDPEVWELYSLLTTSREKNSLEKAVLFQQNAVRCYNEKQSWERDFNLSREILTASKKMAELHLAYIKLLDEGVKEQQKASARLSLQSVISRVEEFDFFSDAEKEELNEMVESLEKSFNEIMNL